MQTIVLGSKHSDEDFAALYTRRQEAPAEAEPAERWAAEPMQWLNQTKVPQDQANWGKRQFIRYLHVSHIKWTSMYSTIVCIILTHMLNMYKCSLDSPAATSRPAIHFASPNAIDETSDCSARYFHAIARIETQRRSSCIYSVHDPGTPVGY